MSVCGEHKELDKKIDHVVTVVNRLDHGINGVNGSIGLVKRVENMEVTIRQNRALWGRLRGLTSHGAIVIRMLLVSILIAMGSGLGGYLWVTITAGGH